MSTCPKLKLRSLPVRDACVVEIPRFLDQRGFLEELYNDESYPQEITRYFPVKQNTMSRSKKHVVRGIHKSEYAKLLTCVSGAVYDVVVDLRPESPTYLQWAAVELTEDNCRQLLIPPNCGHAFCSLSENSTVIYCQGGCFDKTLKTEKAVYPLDSMIDIYWPVPHGTSCIMSEKDQAAPTIDNHDMYINPRRKRILIVGASGQVGGVLMEAIQKESDQYIAIGTYGQHPQEGLVHFDMEKAAKDIDECKFLLTMCHPAVVCICAAFPWVDGCEKFVEKSRSINVGAVENLCNAAQEIGAKIVYYSTDYVFDGVNGSKEKVTESAIPSPLSAYGRQKLAAENIVLNANRVNLVIRTSRIFGPEIQGKNFVYAVVKNVRSGQKVNCLKDEVSCVTYNRDLAYMTLGLLKLNQHGIFHCVGPDYFNKADWGRMICRYFNLDQSKIEEVSACGDTKRPGFVAMDNSKVRNLLSDLKLHSFNDAMNHWRNNAFGDKTLFTS